MVLAAAASSAGSYGSCSARREAAEIHYGAAAPTGLQQRPTWRRSTEQSRNVEKKVTVTVVDGDPKDVGSWKHESVAETRRRGRRAAQKGNQNGSVFRLANSKMVEESVGSSGAQRDDGSRRREGFICNRGGKKIDAFGVYTLIPSLLK